MKLSRLSFPSHPEMGVIVVYKNDGDGYTIVAHSEKLTSPVTVELSKERYITISDCYEPDGEDFPSFEALAYECGLSD